jgi:HSP20 family protein
MPQRDLFANFQRMRKEVDQLLGDAWGRRAWAFRDAGFSPRVDVYFSGDPRRCVVKADLAGIELDAVNLEITGRELVITGQRPNRRETEGRVYQQVEIDTGPFRRVVELGADVEAEEAQATYEDGILRVELPVREASEVRQVPIERGAE